MRRRIPFDLITYLAEQANNEEFSHGNGSDNQKRRIPSLNVLSAEKNVSVATLREQLGVARALGLVEVRPKTGIRRLDYTFSPAVFESLAYAIAVDRSYFEQFSKLRKQVEIAFWFEAVEHLTAEDKAELQQLVEQAWKKLHADPIRLPHKEHRDLHMTFFRRLDNVFVQGVIESYWEAYEEVGLARYEGLAYLEEVWDYHRRIVEALCVGDYPLSHQLMIDHMELIAARPEK